MSREKLHKAFATRIKDLYQKRSFLKGGSFISSPIQSFKALKKGRKMQHKQHAGRNALGQMVRARLVCGPELNIVLLGIPFLIDFGISYGMGKFQKPGTQFAARRNANRLRVVENPRIIDPADVSSQQPLTPAPFSDQAQVIYNLLIQAGMSNEGARTVVNEEHHGEDVADHLTEEDVTVLANAIGTILVPYLAEPGVAQAEASAHLENLAA